MRVPDRLPRLDVAHARPDVARTWADEPVVFVLLDEVGTPARDTGHHENGGVQRDLQTEGVVQPAGGPVEVGKQVFLLGENALARRLLRRVIVLV